MSNDSFLNSDLDSDLSASHGLEEDHATLAREENKSARIALQERVNGPACFAAASCFAYDSEVCKSCTLYVECGKASMQTLERLQEVINVKDIIKRHEKARLSCIKKLADEDALARAERKPGNIERDVPKGIERETPIENVQFDLTAEQSKLIEKLPVKAQSFAVTLCKSGMIDQIKNDLAQNKNALQDKGPRWIALAIDMLLKGGFKRSELKQALITGMTWGDSTAGSHTSLVVKIFLIFNIAVENNQGCLVTAQK